MHYIYCFFPLFSLVDPETVADAPVIDYVDDDSYYTGGAYYYVQPADDDRE